MQYLLVWITKLPANADGKFVLTINEITVLTPGRLSPMTTGWPRPDRVCP